MHSRLYTKKSAFVLIGAFVVLLIGCIMINVFMIKPAVAGIERENASSAEEGLIPKKTDDGFIYYLITDDDGNTYAMIAKYQGNSKNVVIPNNFEGYPLKEIGETCFSENNRIEIVDVPDSVVLVDSMAFSECHSLKEVHIPASVTEIGYEIGLDSDFVICTAENSVAMQYAVENGIACQTE